MKWRFAVLGLAFVAQLAQLGMVFGRAELASRGEEYRFRTAPVDPVDAFRGRYVRLNFPGETLPLPEGVAVADGSDMFATLERDAEGFARFVALHGEAPPGRDAVPVEITSTTERTATVRLGFDRFYLPEYEAPRVEARMRELGGRAVAVVRVNGDRAVLADLLVDVEALGALPPLAERIVVPDGTPLPDALLLAIEGNLAGMPAACAAPASCVAFPTDLDPEADVEWVMLGSTNQLDYYVEESSPDAGERRFVWRAGLRSREWQSPPSASELAALLEVPGAVEPVAPQLRDLRIGDRVVGVPY